MKKLLQLFLIILLPSCVATKPLQLSYKDYTVEKEILSNKSKNDLFVIANSWMVETFNSATNVIQFSDKEAGMIKGRYLMGGSITPGSTYVAESDNRVFAIITVQVKDSLTKIIIAPQGEGTYYAPNPNALFIMKSSPGADEIKTKAEAMISEYEAFIADYKKW